MNFNLQSLLDALSTLQEQKFAPEQITEKIQFLIDHKFHAFPLLRTSDNKQMKAQEYFELISTLAEICPSTALSLSMHLYTIWGLGSYQGTRSSDYLEKVLTEDVLFGSLNEPGLYFVNPAQLQPQDFGVRAVKRDDGYVVTGMKKFVSLEPFVRYLPVYCMVEGDETNQAGGIVSLIVDKEAEGLTVIPDWDSIAMPHTSSNSVKFENVFVPHDHVIVDENTPITDIELQGYLFRFNVSCVYYGIAKKSIRYVTQKSKERKVPNVNKSLAHFPGVQFSLAEMLILLETSRSQMMSCCEVIDQYIEDKQAVKDRIRSVSLITKEYVTRSAEEIVNKAMKIEGIASLSEKNLLSSLYKDVKAGRFHPPQPDVTYELLAKEAFGIITLKTRWC